jgi:hypothetical protein
MDTLCFALAHMARAIDVLTLVDEQVISLHRLMRTRASRDTSPHSKSLFNNMQHEQSTSAHGVDTLPHATEHRNTEHIQIPVSALELRSFEEIQASNTALLAQLRRLIGSTVPTN